jgi:urate oxidase
VNGTETHTVFVSVDKSKKIDVTSGIRGWKVLKTTQSGYEGYLKDKYTMLPETNDRIVATEVTATWKYAAPVRNYSAAYEGVKAAMVEAFFGPSKGGVYSPSVQYTLFEMARMAIDRSVGTHMCS